MKKFSIYLCTAGFIFCIVGIANAIPMTTHVDSTVFDASGAWDSITHEDDLNNPDTTAGIGYGWGDVNYLNNTDDYVEWKHQYDPNNFVPPAATILGGALSLYLADDQDIAEGTWTVFGVTFSGLEYANLQTEDGSLYNLGEIDTGTYGPFSINAAFLNDGEFIVRLTSQWNGGIGSSDFYINQSDLEIDYAPVPEPGTLLLLGSGLIGIITSRKRFLNRT